MSDDLHQADGTTTESDDCRQDDPVIPAACGAFVFNLDSAEGERRMRDALNAQAMKSILWDLIYEPDEGIRHMLRYEYDAGSAEAFVLERVQKLLNDLCEEHGIRLDEE